MAKPNNDLPVFTWFLVGALLFSIFTFLLGVWVCANAPRAGETSTDLVPVVMNDAPLAENQDRSTPSSEIDRESAPVDREIETATPLPEPVATPAPAKASPRQAAVTTQSRPQTPVSGPRSEKKKTTVAGSKTYYIQLVATTDRKSAVKLKQRLEAKGYNVYLLSSKRKRRTLYRVRIGVFKNYRQARSIAARIGKEYKLKPWIIAE